MKLVILAVSALLLVSQTEALKCHCGGKAHCPHPVEICTGTRDACISAVFHPPIPGHFKSCYNETECEKLKQSSLLSLTCCKGDLCN